MNNTPETDQNAVPHIGFYSCATVTAEFARKLERERDQAIAGRQAYKQLAVKHAQERDEARAERDILRLDAQREAEHHDRLVGEFKKVYRERDEARAELSLKCQSVTIASGTISDLLKKSERLEKQIEGLNNFANERFDEIQRVRRERDEAREAFKEMWRSGDAFLPHVDSETINRWRKAAGWEETK
jgi:hypothetical protein